MGVMGWVVSLPNWFTVLKMSVGRSGLVYFCILTTYPTFWDSLRLHCESVKWVSDNGRESLNKSNPKNRDLSVDIQRSLVQWAVWPDLHFGQEIPRKQMSHRAPLITK